jgi:hypothetical protein
MKNAAKWKGPGRPPAFMLFMAAVLPLLIACAAAVPVVTGYAIDFAEDLLASASDNYSPDYAEDLKELLTILVAETKTPTETAYPGQASTPTTPLALEVAVLVQRASAGGLSDPVPIADGATLYSDPNDPAAGDKLKISIRANCDCFVYVIFWYPCSRILNRSTPIPCRRTNFTLFRRQTNGMAWMPTPALKRFTLWHRSRGAQNWSAALNAWPNKNVRCARTTDRYARPQ